MENLSKLQTFLDNYLSLGKNGLLCLDDKKILYVDKEDLFKILTITDFYDKKSIKLFNNKTALHKVIFGKIIKNKLKISEKPI